MMKKVILSLAVLACLGGVAEATPVVVNSTPLITLSDVQAAAAGNGLVVSGTIPGDPGVKGKVVLSLEAIPNYSVFHVFTAGDSVYPVRISLNDDGKMWVAPLMELVKHPSMQSIAVEASGGVWAAVSTQCLLTGLLPDYRQETDVPTGTCSTQPLTRFLSPNPAKTAQFSGATITVPLSSVPVGRGFILRAEPYTMQTCTTHQGTPCRSDDVYVDSRPAEMTTYTIQCAPGTVVTLLVEDELPAATPTPNPPAYGRINAYRFTGTFR